VHHEDQIIADELRTLNDADFHHQFESIVSVELAATIRVLHFINELDRRKSFLEMGYSSVLDYCMRKLGYSRSGAGRRIQAARCARRYPEVFGMLRTRELSPGTAALIESILIDDNKDEILSRIRGASHREIERVVSEYRPPVALRDRFHFVQVPVPAPKNADAEFFGRQCRRSLPEEWRQPVEEKVYVQFLADEEFMKLFEEVRNLMPDGGEQNIADVMRRVLTEYRDRHSPAARHARREAKNGSARLESQRWECDNTQSRHIPDEVRDMIFVRDRGQCTFVAADGTRCQCRKNLQLDHIKPFAAGGTHHPENLRLLCGAHNRLAAEHVLGKHVMQAYWRQQ
jgi:5-methylcytosine-specific restriction endonuclease McrA